MDNFAWEIAKVSFYLLLVLAVIYLLSYLIKNNISKSGKGRYINIIEQVYLAPKRSLALVAVHDTVLLISNSEDKIRVLEKWNKSDFPGSGDALKNGHSFKEYLQKNFRKI